MLPFNSEERAEPVVRALMKAYRGSRHSRTGAGRREYHIRYDKLVHELAHATVVQQKRGHLLLERLREAGLIRWDHTPLRRSEIKTIYIAAASENGLFAAIGETPPSVERGRITGVLAKHMNALDGHSHESEWQAVLRQAIEDINNGRSAEGLPNDDSLHNDILLATAAVLNNRQRILLRRLSSEKLGGSKILRDRRESVERFMAQFLPPDLATLEAWKVANVPPMVLLRGPLGIELDDGTRIDELPSNSPHRIKEEILARACRTFTSAKRCLSIENLTTFHETVEANTDDLIVHTSYPSSSVVRLLRLLPASVHLQHWGDTDPFGYDILRVLREKTGRAIYPWRMDYRPGAGEPLTKREQAVISRLIADPLVADIRSELTAMQTAGNKGIFEQESLPAVDR